LGVNVDHVATVRQARGGLYPDPVHAALQAEIAGADGITMHLREDRRHIQDHDVERFAACTQSKLNLEIAATDEMLAIAKKVKPHDVCIVPEKREELTTEGGLDVIAQQSKLTTYCAELHEEGIAVSLFIDPDEAQIETAARIGAPVIEIHTGRFADAKNDTERASELAKIVSASDYAYSLGMWVNAGHGLQFNNIQRIAAIETIHELNIGHSLIARAMFTGLPEAVKEMKRLMVEARYFSSSAV
ncbi:UNVERIFIED_CONTAM: hypothetical protein GTU68_064544, partial [Idotea baltica]|nr:hypothetical protein [Idotea baltica]